MLDGRQPRTQVEVGDVGPRLCALRLVVGRGGRLPAARRRARPASHFSGRLMRGPPAVGASVLNECCLEALPWTTSVSARRVELLNIETLAGHQAPAPHCPKVRSTFYRPPACKAVKPGVRPQRPDRRARRRGARRPQRLVGRPACPRARHARRHQPQLQYRVHLAHKQRTHKRRRGRWTLVVAASGALARRRRSCRLKPEELCRPGPAPPERVSTHAKRACHQHGVPPQDDCYHWRRHRALRVWVARVSAGPPCAGGPTRRATLSGPAAQEAPEPSRRRPRPASRQASRQPGGQAGREPGRQPHMHAQCRDHRADEGLVCQWVQVAA
jgi:hypothetical protein